MVEHRGRQNAVSVPPKGKRHQFAKHDIHYYLNLGVIVFLREVLRFYHRAAVLELVEFFVFFQAPNAGISLFVTSLFRLLTSDRTLYFAATPRISRRVLALCRAERPYR